MSNFKTHINSTYEASVISGKKIATESLNQGKKVVVLTPNSRVAHYVKKVFAQAKVYNCKNEVLDTGTKLPSLGPTITTFNKWIYDRWGLYGDGRVLVNQFIRSFQVRCLVNSLIEETSFEIEFSDGLICVVEDLAKNYLPLIVNTWQEKQDLLTPVQKFLCMATNVYSMWLEQDGYIEFSQMVDSLAHNADMQKSSFNDTDFVLVGFDQVSMSMKQMLEMAQSNGAQIFVEALDDEKLNLTNIDRVTYKKFEPAGETAVSGLVYKIVAEKPDRNYVVVSNNPDKIYKTLHEPLAKIGLTSQVNTLISISQTLFGGALLSLIYLVLRYEDTLGREEMLAYAIDFSNSPFSGISHKDAQNLEAKWRSSRSITRDQIMDDLTEKCSKHVATSDFVRNKDAQQDDKQKQPGNTTSDRFSQAIEGITKDGKGYVLNAFSVMVLLVLERSYYLLIDLLANVADEKGLDIASKNAIAFTKSMLDETISYDLSSDEMITFLSTYNNMNNKVSVPYRLKEEPGNAKIYPEDKDTLFQSDPCGKVIFTDLKSTSFYEPESSDVLIMTDLTSGNYPVRPSENAVTMLLESLGCEINQNKLTEARGMMQRCLSVPSKACYFGRPEVDANSAPTYPAVVLEDIEDALSKEGCVDNVGAVKESETNLVYNRYFIENPKETIETSKNPFCSDEKRDFYSKNRFSASAIETYLDCPYKWFAQRKLRIENIDAGFEALERGTFAHEVLKNTYEEMADREIKHVTEDNLDEVIKILDYSFDVELEVQKHKDADSGLYVPLTPAENLQAEELKRNLRFLIERDASFLSGFNPTYFEYKFGYDEPVYYAGMQVCGSVDRIDVDKDGNAVVIDYKGSAGNSYPVIQTRIAGLKEAFELPEKVQALIYASVVQRELGLNVVGALYRAYNMAPGRQDQVGTSGAFEARLFDESQLDGAKKKRDAVSNSEYKRPKELENNEEACLNMDKDNFQTLIDKVEKSIEKIMLSLCDTLIDNQASTEEACKYCNVINCPVKCG